MRSDAPDARERSTVSTWTRWLAIFFAANLIAWALLWASASPVRAQSEVRAAAPSAAPVEWGGTLDLQRRLKDVRVEREGQELRLIIDTPDGPVSLSPSAFTERLERAQAEQRAHGWLYRMLNITTPWGVAWVSIGFAGQALFTLRMLLQWWASEREKRSVIPVGFWWGSLFGGLMLFVYFIWRKDIVGIVGQSTGVFVYTRNLVLIYRARAADRSATAAHARTA